MTRDSRLLRTQYLTAGGTVQRFNNECGSGDGMLTTNSGAVRRNQVLRPRNSPGARVSSGVAPARALIPALPEASRPASRWTWHPLDVQEARSMMPPAVGGGENGRGAGGGEFLEELPRVVAPAARLGRHPRAGPTAARGCLARSTAGRSDRRSSPWSMRQRSHSRTCPCCRPEHRPRRTTGVSSSTRRLDPLWSPST